MRIEEAHRAGALPPLLNLCNPAEAATPSAPISSSGELNGKAVPSYFSFHAEF